MKCSVSAVLALLAAVFFFSRILSAQEPLRAGISIVDISPLQLPAIRNGGFLESSSDQIDDPLFARALVLAKGDMHVGLVVVDSCMLPRDVCDAIKDRIVEATDLPRHHIMVCATHTHSAPSTMDMCLGTRRDPAYTASAIPRIAASIVQASEKLQPARIGWGAHDDWDHTKCRRWIRRTDTMTTDPFGERTVQAMMHPGYNNREYVGPSGPVDPQFSLLSITTASNQPLCLLANYSMHYYGGTRGFSAEYFGDFSRRIEKRVTEKHGEIPFLAMLSQGTSGDLHWYDYSRDKRRQQTRQQYTERIVERAWNTWQRIEHEEKVPLDMAEARLELTRRLPSESRLTWARKLNQARGDRRPKNKPEVYAEQAEWIEANPREELVLQAMRIGDLALTAMPNEVYGITGLKLKQLSPFDLTINMSLANGAAGYIPPPEQHVLGGYTTWPARTAGLEVEAEPKIVEEVIRLLESTAGKPRRELKTEHGTYAKEILAGAPLAYWRLEDWIGPTAEDATENHPARYEDRIAFYLPGARREGGAKMFAAPETNSTFSGSSINRAAHFAGGRLHAELDVGASWSVELWCWPGTPFDFRPITGYLVSRGEDGDRQALGEHLGIGGTAKNTTPGALFLYTGNEIGDVVSGHTPLRFRDWHHIVFVRDGNLVRIYLDGQLEVQSKAKRTLTPAGARQFFVGGRCDGMFPFEGKIDEISVYDRPLTPDEVAGHFKVSERKALIPEPESQPKPAKEALKELHVPDGYRVELVASEPLISDPVAFDWDVYGHLWVVEMADYPMGMDHRGKPGGRVRRLEDRNNDGVYDHGTLIADGLNFPNGILCWQDGALITAAPEILFVQEGARPEIRFSGLSEGNQQLRANGLRYGLDHRIYVAAGGHHSRHAMDTEISHWRAGEIRGRVKVGSRDFSIDPDDPSGGSVRPETGPSQFGRSRNDWGHWFGTQNSRPLWHVVLPDAYLLRNPHLTVTEATHQLVTPLNPPVWPLSEEQKRYHSVKHTRRYTSACGSSLYRDEKLFPAEEQHAFICEPYHNLVQHMKLTANVATFTAKRPEKKSEPDFLASPDRWFRPVMTRTGPDGALWVADMHRYMIEHPHWLPPQGKKELQPHYRLGSDRGRIYRIVKTGEAGSTAPLGDTPEAWLKALASSNGWRRDRAQMELIQDGAENPGEVARRLEEQTDPKIIVQMLWTLKGFKHLTSKTIIKYLKSNHPRVRETAVKLAEAFDDPPLMTAVAARVKDPHAAVRLQLAFSLGAWKSERAGIALTRLLERSADIDWIVTAGLSSALPHLDTVANSIDPETSPVLAARLMQVAVRTENRTAMVALLQKADVKWLREMLILCPELVDVLKAGGDILAPALQRLDQIWAEARERIRDGTKDMPLRIESAGLLLHQPADRVTAQQVLLDSLTADQPGDQSRRSIQLLQIRAENPVAESLLDKLSEVSPAVAESILEAVLSRSTWTAMLLNRLEEGQLTPHVLSLTGRQRLLEHTDSKIGKRARAILTPASSSRARILETYRVALSIPGDGSRGRQVYERACMGCHRFGENEGRSLGPDLKSVASHPTEKLLSSILDPNADIQPGFQAYLCSLKSGEQIYGLLTGEHASSIGMRLADGSERILLREQIVRLKNSGRSFMPEGLEAALTVQDVADLIAFLRRP